MSEEKKIEFSQKDNNIEMLLKQIFSNRGIGKCVICGSDKLGWDDFRDEISRRECAISQMCQKCQDEVFGPEDEED